MWSDVIIVFMLAFVTAYIFTPISIRIAKKVGAIDIPNQKRKKQKVGMPRLGGFAVIAGFLIAITYMIISKVIIENNYSLISEYKMLISFLLGILVISGVGYLDDKTEGGISPLKKLIGQCIAAIIVIAGGVRIAEISLPLSPEMIQFGQFLSILITFLWIVGVTNAINIIDGLDGLSSGIILISAIYLSIIFVINGSSLISLFMIIALAGSVAGFLPFNISPAKTYVGDIGSNFMGYAISVISITGFAKTYTAIVLIAPILVLAIPIFDTIFAIIRRVVKHKSLKAAFIADAGHLHHRLLSKGLTTKQTVHLLYITTGLLGMFAIILIDGGIVKTVSYVIITMLVLAIGKRDIMNKIKENMEELDKNNKNIQ